ncbi:MAG: response regulator [Desulfobacterales bacterium]|nr:response regulator [Desulfobacterales bacterium]MCP4161067.1 response regulator [Deltaproteobacteria bacterium]
MSLKIKFFIPVFLLISLVMAITIIFSHNGTKHTIESLLYKQIELQADTTETLVSSWIKRNRVDIEIMARKSEIKALFDKKISKKQYKIVLENLNSVVRAHNTYELIGIFDTKGDQVLTTMKNSASVNTFDRAYFKKTLTGYTVVSDIIYSKYTKNPVFVISAPIYSNNEIKGTLIGVIKIANFIKTFIDKVKIGKLGKSYIFDSNGLTLSFKDKSKLIDINNPETGFSGIMKNHSFGVFKCKHNNDGKIVVLKKVSDLGWIIAISAVESDFFKALNHHREFIIVLSFWMAVILGAGIWFMILRFVIKPIGTIVTHIRGIDVDKDTLKKEIPVKSNDEVGELTKTLNHMALKLNQSMFNLKNEVQEKKLAEEALMAERDNSSNIIYNSPNIICEIAPDGSTIFINPTGLRLTGYSKKEILGRNWWQILGSKNEVKKFENLLKLLEKQNINDYEMAITSRNGSIHTLSWTYIKKFNEAGEFTSTIGIGNDISRRKIVEKQLKKAHSEMEKRVHERTRELVLANEAASESANAKSEFLANMSHEIRTPMNAIIGMCDLVLDTNLSKKQNNFIKIIRSSSRSLLELINDILDFSKIDAGKLVFENLKFNLRDIIEEVTDMYLDKSLEKDIELIVDIDPDVPREVTTDPLRLRQILVNLITNAFKFTSEGEICISVRKNFVKDNNAEIEFCVRDTGIGIKEELSNKLFDVFAQADGSTTREYGGTGLGLAICKKIVDQMDGKIWILSEFGVGSSFYFTVNLEVVNSIRVNKNKAPHELEKLKVLIVEDNPSTMLVLKRFIESFGFKAAMATNGENAIEMFKKSPDGEYGLILMDVKLPGIDGISTSKIIKRTNREIIPPIIAISNLGNNIENAKQVGIDSYMIKPIKQSLLFDTIMQNLGYPTNSVPKKKPDLFSSGEFNNTKILLVEDNAINQMVACEILLSAGISVDKAATGLQAIEMVQEHRDYNAILMDIQMPEMDGIEATKIIKKKMNIKNIPIIAMTAHAMYGDKERCFEAGMDDYVPKPIDQKELFKALRKNIFKFEVEYEIENETEDHEQNKLPGLNVKEGVLRLGGNQEIYSEIVNEFCKTFNNFAKDFESFLSKESYSDAKMQAHSLKGAAGNISADGLYYTAKLLEKACMKEDKDHLFNILPEIEEHINEIKSSSKLIKTNKKNGSLKSEKIEIFDIVKNLSKSLDDSDPIESEVYLNKFKTYVLHNIYDTNLLLIEKKLVSSVTNYDYDSAKNHLNNFSKVLKSS